MRVLSACLALLGILSLRSSFLHGEVCYFPGTYGGDQTQAKSEAQSREDAWDQMIKQQMLICNRFNKQHHNPDDCFMFDPQTSAPKGDIDFNDVKRRIIQGELVIFLAPGEKDQAVITFSEPGYSSEYEGYCPETWDESIDDVKPGAEVPDPEKQDLEADFGLDKDGLVRKNKVQVDAEAKDEQKPKLEDVSAKEADAGKAAEAFDLASAKPTGPPAVDLGTGGVEQPTPEAAQVEAEALGKGQSRDFSLSPDKRIAAKERAALKNINAAVAKERKSAAVDKVAKLEIESYAITTCSFLDCLSYAPDVVALSACVAVCFDSQMR